MTDDLMESMLELIHRPGAVPQKWYPRYTAITDTCSRTTAVIEQPLTKKREGKRLKTAKCFRCDKYSISKGDRAVVLQTFYIGSEEEDPKFCTQYVYHPKCFNLDVGQIPTSYLITYNYCDRED